MTMYHPLKPVRLMPLRQWPHQVILWMWRIKILHSLPPHVAFWLSMTAWMTTVSTTTLYSVRPAFPVKPPGFLRKTRTKCILWMMTMSHCPSLCRKTRRMLLPPSFHPDFDDDEILVLESIDREQVLMDPLVFPQACKRIKFKPSADLFASATHKRLHRYSSRTPHPKAL